MVNSQEREELERITGHCGDRRSRNLYIICTGTRTTLAADGAVIAQLERKCILAKLPPGSKRIEWSQQRVENELGTVIQKMEERYRHYGGL